MYSQFLRRAVELACENVRCGRGGPFGAVIVRDGEVIAEGVNLVTSSHDPTAHAEVCAIRSACASLGVFDLRGCEIYSSCEPCPMCLGAIYWARLDALYYAATREDAAAAGFDDSFIHDEVRLPDERRSILVRNALREEGAEPFALWRASADKIPY
jgi:tRNA(Arg) A34 adenosine deaminase TadA